MNTINYGYFCIICWKIAYSIQRGYSPFTNRNIQYIFYNTFYQLIVSNTIQKNLYFMLKLTFQLYFSISIRFSSAPSFLKRKTQKCDGINRHDVNYNNIHNIIILDCDWFISVNQLHSWTMKLIITDQIKRSQTIISFPNLSIFVIFNSSFNYSVFFWQGFFSALRSEIYQNGIAVSIVCPGPIKSAIVQNAFSEKCGEACRKYNIQ
jgi:hypothetical protein